MLHGSRTASFDVHTFEKCTGFPTCASSFIVGTRRDTPQHGSVKLADTRAKTDIYPDHLRSRSRPGGPKENLSDTLYMQDLDPRTTPPSRTLLQTLSVLFVSPDTVTPKIHLQTSGLSVERIRPFNFRAEKQVVKKAHFARYAQTGTPPHTSCGECPPLKRKGNAPTLRIRLSP